MLFSSTRIIISKHPERCHPSARFFLFFFRRGGGSVIDIVASVNMI